MIYHTFQNADGNIYIGISSIIPVVHVSLQQCSSATRPLIYCLLTLESLQRDRKAEINISGLTQNCFLWLVYTESFINLLRRYQRGPGDYSLFIARVAARIKRNDLFYMASFSPEPWTLQTVQFLWMIYRGIKHNKSTCQAVFNHVTSISKL